MRMDPLRLGGSAAALTAIACGLPASAQQITYEPLYMFNGDAEGDRFGWSVSGAGDVNNDGFDDLIIGAPDSNAGASNGGQARVISGADGAELYSYLGNESSDHLGTSVSGAGDVDGDGFDDFVIGELSRGTSSIDFGSARVYSGATGQELYAFFADGRFDRYAASVSGAGDVNGDGFNDIIVGSSLDDRDGIVNSGTAFVYSGATGDTLYTFTGTDVHDRVGSSVSGAGDIDGDGFDDLIIGASESNGQFRDDPGRATVISGATGNEIYTFFGDANGDEFGTSVSGAGDVNGDGFDDLIVGSFRSDINGSNAGIARIFSGATGDELYTITGDDPNDWFGISVSGAGDVNGDGFDDLLVGASADSGTDTVAGSVSLLSGIDGSLLARFDGLARQDQLGFSVSDAGDVNGDGMADFIIGAIEGGANGGGYAVVYISVPTPGAAGLLAIAGLAAARRRRG